MKSKNVQERAERLLKISPKIMMTLSRMHAHVKSELTGNQYQALLFILERQKCSVNDLSKTMRLAQSTTSQLIDRLVNAGFVIREINPKNRRSMVIWLSPKGEKMVSAHSKSMKDSYVSLFRLLKEDDQKILEEAFKNLYLMFDKIQKMNH